VSPAPLSFSLEFSSQGVPVPLLEELAGRVFRHVGCTTVPVNELTAALTNATSGGVFGGAARCDVQLRAHDSKLEILVSANGGRLWQASCAISPAVD
jgi:hypothetical protein